VHIIELRINDVYGIEAFHIKPNGEHVIIGGKNRAGKSSAINALKAALGGAGERRNQRVKDGAEKGEVVVDLGDLVVKYVARPGKKGNDELVIESPDGETTYKRPATMLKRLWGERSFDPLAFFDAEPKERMRIFAELVGVDLQAMENERNKVFAARALVNRLAKQTAAQAAGYDIPDDVPAEPVDTDAIVAELRAAQENNSKRVAMVARLADIENTALVTQKKLQRETDELGVARVAEAKQNSDRAVAEAEEVFLRAQQALELARVRRNESVVKAEKQTAGFVAEYQEKLAELRERAEKGRKAIDAHEAVDEDAIALRLSQAQATNALVSERQARDKIQSQADGHEAESKRLTKKLEAIDKRQADAIAAAPIPVEGLTFTEAGLVWNGRPLEDFAASEQLEVALGLDIARNPEIGIMLVDRWNDLDEELREKMFEMADAAKIQIVATTVGETDADITVIIREGRLAA